MKLDLVTVRPNLNKKGLHTLHRGRGVRGGVVCYRTKSFLLFKEEYIDKKGLKRIVEGKSYKFPCAGLVGMPLPNYKGSPKVVTPISLNFESCSFECDEPLTLGDLILIEGHRFYKVVK